MTVEYIKEFSEDYMALMKESHRMHCESENIVGYINISTCTMVANLGTHINLMGLLLHFKSPLYPICTIKQAKSSKEYEYTKRGKQKKSFYNQATITYKENTTKSIKVFTNGKLQMTGMTSMKDAIRAIETVSGILENAKCVSIKPSIVSIDIEMINSNFRFSKELDLKAFANVMRDTKYDSSYEPDVYPGVIIKHNGSSIFVFGTGNVVITGAKHLESIKMSYVYISELLMASSQCHLRKTQCVTKKQNMKRIHGYTTDAYDACLVPH